MKKPNVSFPRHLALAAMIAGSIVVPIRGVGATNEQPTPVSITGVERLNPTTVELKLSNGNRMTVDFYGDNIFRLFRDDNGGILRNPAATPPAEILVKSPRKLPGTVNVSETPADVKIATDRVELTFAKTDAQMSVKDIANGKTVVRETAPMRFERGKTKITFAENPGEYFYGGGVQNGRFSHKGKTIAIENQNSWTDGGVASPTPFYWSTDGYGVMFNTFEQGKYDFGASQPGNVSLTHNSDYLDAFIMVDETPEALLSDFYQLTGNPVLLPKFGFYEGHLNAYNRDFWKEDEKGILFEDGKRYKESQQDNGGIKESLNGENDNYQFSARAVVDRYAAHDMPLGWVLPNDGYGAGYGQTETLDGNIANLKSFGDYARSKGVEIGLWTQSDLHPKDGVSALLQRDIVKEVRDAGVRVLKTDVAWVGYGYSFGLNGVADVGEVMPYYGNDARPFIISLDGWAGTQRYAGVWSGDQTGGEWEYIRFHIPTYIGSGLSGQPNITSDMDGIFGGKNPVVNTRDFQWKTFTPMQLNMDGWGSNEKYPHALGEPATSINRNYLKLKSELMPYAYTYAREAVDGKPLIRAMFLDYPNDFTHSVGTRYQYLYGPSLLVAPIYQATAIDTLGNDIRNGIYLPKGTWIDYFNGEAYNGEAVLNNFDAPLWKLPVFVKMGAIIPLANPSNNPSEIDQTRRIFEFYPSGRSEFRLYDDDGTTQAYLGGNQSVTTNVISEVQNNGVLKIDIAPSEGTFAGYDPMKSTELIINTTKRPKQLAARIGKERVKLGEATSLADFESAEGNVWFYNAAPEFNRFATPGSEFESTEIKRGSQIMVKLAKTNVDENAVELLVKGFDYAPTNTLLSSHGSLAAPSASVTDDGVGAYTLTASWQPIEGADYYEIEFQGLPYTNIKTTDYTFGDLTPDTPYEFKIRAVNADGASDWVEFNSRTKTNPLEFAIRDIRGESSAQIQPGFEVRRLFDFAESGDIFCTRYRTVAVPFDLTLDLQGVNTIDKFHYLPRTQAGYGTFMRGAVEISLDKENWTPVDSFRWENNADVKEFIFAEQPQARYIRIHVDESGNGMGSGREIYVFKVPGTETYLPGDINNDGKIDTNDLTSYMNYTGLRSGDADFEGYVSNGDINHNGLIDAFDISTVATRLEDGVEIDEYASPLAGTLEMKVTKEAPAVGDTLELTVSGVDLKSVNALSMAIPYDGSIWQYVGIEPLAVASMENLTRDRQHSNGEKVVYPTFVNIGEKATLNGSEQLFTVRFKRLKRGAAPTTFGKGMLVDKSLNTIKL